MAKTKTQKEAKLVKKNKNLNVPKPIKVQEKVLKVKKPVKAATKTKKKTVGDVKTAGKKPAVSKAIVVKEANVTYKAKIVDILGKEAGSMSLPSGVFGIRPNKKLISQAVRVYLANQRQGTSSTKTRGEVVGSKRKIYRQKGTGRARHGANKAPIFVGGGIAFGPHPRDFSLKLPQKMRKIALFSALSEKAKNGSIRVIDGDFSGRTKEVSKFFKTLNITNKQGKVHRVLLVVGSDAKARQGGRNIKGLDIENVKTISTYEVVINRDIFFLKSAVDEISQKVTK